MSSVINDPGPSIGEGIERTDLSSRTMIVGMMVIFGVVLLTGIFVALVYRFPRLMSFGEGRSGIEHQYRIPDDVLQMPTPRNYVVPGEDLAKLRAEENELLGSYAWLDKNSGTVRIPIERAIDLIAERGLPSSK